MTDKKRVLICDMNNLFIRGWIADPTLSTNGDPIGGIVNFFKSLQKFVKETSPNLIISVWDGAGGSLKKRQKNKNYKDGRKPLNLNRFINNLNEGEIEDNRVWQMTKLVEWMEYCPIHQFMVENVEADDVIAHISQMKYFEEFQKIIISSDKDFIQLLGDPNIVLYRPTQKEILNSKRVVEKFGIHPNNFVIARAIDGDKSDNLEGVKGVGLKSVAKYFDFLSKEESCLLSEVLEYCEGKKEEAKVFDKIFNDKERVKENYNLMQLFSPNTSFQEIQKIEFIIKNEKLYFNKTKLLLKMIEEGASDWNYDALFMRFNIMTQESK